jgi:UDP-glucose 4-epimerase
MLIADPSAARRDLGFKPAHSSLDAIIATAWRWHRNIAKHR